ncbi:NUDIX hydrolase [Bacillus sp. AK031]
MREWNGAAAICLNEQKEVLVVRGAGTNIWSVPTGGIEQGETPEECCVREVKEETGYTVSIVRRLYVKEKVIQGINVTTHYFKVVKDGGEIAVNDHDQDIAEADWKSIEEYQQLEQMYPEDLLLIKELAYT